MFPWHHPDRCSLQKKIEMEALPTQSEVYKRLASGLEGFLAEQGAQRVRRVSWPCWLLNRPDEGEKIYLSLQVERHATDPYGGGGFLIELEKSASSQPSSGLNGRALFFQLLTAAELSRVLVNQNRVIQALPRPPRSQVDLYPAGPVRDEYLSWFTEQKGFDAIRSWMRYRTIDNIDQWILVLGPLMSDLLERAAEYLDLETLHLGRGSLIQDRP